MRVKTSRTAPDELAGKEYMYPAFANKTPFPEKKTGRMPAMGWNSWNAFGSGNTEALTKAMAEKMTELGLDKLGYEYLVLDDGCYLSERVDGRLQNEPQKFPSGFRALSDFIHEKGLKFGMYNDIGTNLCAGSAVGTCGYEDVDAKSYIDWGVDFLKVDNCYYLWDNATFSNPENARFTFAPNIRGIRIKGAETELTLQASDGELLGRGACREADFVTSIGTFDGTNTGTTPVGAQSGELLFTVDAKAEEEAILYVTYATDRQSGCGEWLQVAVGEEEGEERVYDGLMPPTEGPQSFIESDGIRIRLHKGVNKIRLMNHRRQENTLNSYAAMFYGLQAADPENEVQLSICEWGKTQPQNWGYKVGNSWRILNDITFCVGADGNPGKGSWDDPGTQSIASQYNKAVVMDEFASPVLGWNDPDMMVIGMNEITETMSRSHMEMWCMMNSPLMLGMDLRRVEKGDQIYRIIANQELIALNQDALGVQAKRVYSTLEEEHPDTTYITDNDRVDILAKPLANGDFAVSFFNLSREEKDGGFSVSLDTILQFLKHKSVNAEAWEKATGFTATDLVSGESREIDGRTLRVEKLEGCGSRTFRICTKRN